LKFDEFSPKIKEYTTKISFFFLIFAFVQIFIFFLSKWSWGWGGAIFPFAKVNQHQD